MNRVLNIGSIVYLLLPPNNQKKQYRYVKCTVNSLYLNNFEEVYSIEYFTTAIPMEYKVTLRKFDEKKSYFCGKHLDKIYYEDELSQLNEDIDNLNKILEFKQKQKDELKQYIDTEFTNWNYRSKINI